MCSTNTMVFDKIFLSIWCLLTSSYNAFFSCLVRSVRSIACSRRSSLFLSRDNNLQLNFLHFTGLTS